MQDHSPSASQVLLDFLKVLAIPIAGGIGALIARFFEWGKRKPELSILEASAEKTRAEARKLDGEIIDRAHDRIDELMAVNYQLRQDCLALQSKLNLAELREKMYDEGRVRTKAILDLEKTADSKLNDPSSKQDSP